MRRAAAIVLAAALASGPALAEPDGVKEPVPPQVDVHPLKELWSGAHYSSEEARKLQESDADNPAMKLLARGEELWRKVEGKEKRACESCHTDAARTMKGAATTYPAYYKISKKPVTIPGRINLCRERYMDAPPLKGDSEDLLALTLYVKRQSRGDTIDVTADGPLEPFFEEGREYFTTRRGQLDISCANCHDQYAGRMFRDRKLSQGHPNGFPAWSRSRKDTVTLLGQVNQCLERMRANPLEAGSDEVANLELYLMWRASGLKVETPAVRD